MMSTNSTTRNIEERKSVETNINTIGGAILVQTLIRYAAYVAITWISLTFMNDWVLTYIAASR